MVVNKPRVVIIGAGMAGLVAANTLYKSTSFKQLFDLCVVEGGKRIGGRIQTSEFCGNRIEMGATWIHGIGGSPIYKIAKEINSLESPQPWERMDGWYSGSDPPLTISEDGLILDHLITQPISNLFKTLLDFAKGKLISENQNKDEDNYVDYFKIADKVMKICSKNEGFSGSVVSMGSFLKQGLDCYLDEKNESERNLNLKLIQEAVFASNENNQRTYSCCGDLFKLDLNAEKEFFVFPNEEITIPKGYSSIIESLASALPSDLIQLEKKVVKIEWKPEGNQIESPNTENLGEIKPVKLHFEDGSIMETDHVIITVSLGVLKAGIQEDLGMFNPPLPSYKTEAISRLGFGVVNKLFLELDDHQEKKKKNKDSNEFPFLVMAFHNHDSELREKMIPWWMRKTSSMFPIYNKSSVVLSWFAGDEALQLESLSDEEIINGVSTTISKFLPNSKPIKEIENSEKWSNGYVKSVEMDKSDEFKFSKVLKTEWGRNPLFLGSYSYVAVGSSGDDFDFIAKPLPSMKDDDNTSTSLSSPLQILFAGEATHRTQYSTTHGAYFSGIREANRLLQHYNL